jgi:hypothetical protein
VYDEPYLETCCRSALHRLVLSAEMGRPGGLKDGPCLERLAAMGLAQAIPSERFTVTDAGRDRHASEVLKLRPPAPA